MTTLKTIVAAFVAILMTACFAPANAQAPAEQWYRLLAVTHAEFQGVESTPYQASSFTDRIGEAGRMPLGWQEADGSYRRQYADRPADIVLVAPRVERADLPIGRPWTIIPAQRMGVIRLPGGEPTLAYEINLVFFIEQMCQMHSGSYLDQITAFDTARYILRARGGPRYPAFLEWRAQATLAQQMKPLELAQAINRIFGIPTDEAYALSPWVGLDVTAYNIERHNPTADTRLISEKLVRIGIVPLPPVPLRLAKRPSDPSDAGPPPSSARRAAPAPSTHPASLAPAATRFPTDPFPIPATAPPPQGDGAVSYSRGGTKTGCRPSWPPAWAGPGASTR